MDLDTALDELYAAAPEDFVATRARLVKRLKSDGEADAARSVMTRRKPPVAVWAVNQLARRHRDELGELLDAGERLRRAQRKALSGVKSSGMREAARERAAAADRLTRLAARLLQERGAAATAHVAAIHGALTAAAADEDVAQALRRGRLADVPEAATGLDGDWAVLSVVRDAAERELD